jgi:hypothetical protein
LSAFWWPDGFQWSVGSFANRGRPYWRLPVQNRFLGFVGSYPQSGLTAIHLPLWIPASAAAIVLVPLGLVEMTTRRRLREGACRSCAYDLTGITGPCPECGKERNA